MVFMMPLSSIIIVPAIGTLDANRSAHLLLRTEVDIENFALTKLPSAQGLCCKALKCGDLLTSSGTYVQRDIIDLGLGPSG